MAQGPSPDKLAPFAWSDAGASQNLVVIAASAGGLQPLGRVLAGLPHDFPAAIAVIQHRGPESPNFLADILRRQTTLRVQDAVDGDLLEAGTVYVCPVGVHMTVERSLRLVAGPRLDHVRPNADLMLRSAARAYGEQAVGVVLSGHGSDAAEGCRAIRAAGGVVIAQDPASSTVPDMPAATISASLADVVLTADRIAPALAVILADRRGAVATPQPREARVLLVDDHRIIREGLRALLQGEEDFAVVAEAERGQDAVALATALQPDVVVMDVGLPDLDGPAATRRIGIQSPRTRIVALSALSDMASVRRMLDAGAVGYLTKSAAFEELATAIRTVVSGRVYFSSEIVARMIENEPGLPVAGSPMAGRRD